MHWSVSFSSPSFHSVACRQSLVLPFPKSILIEVAGIGVEVVLLGEFRVAESLLDVISAVNVVIDLSLVQAGEFDLFSIKPLLRTCGRTRSEIARAVKDHVESRRFLLQALFSPGVLGRQPPRHFPESPPLRPPPGARRTIPLLVSDLPPVISGRLYGLRVDGGVPVHVEEHEPQVPDDVTVCRPSERWLRSILPGVRTSDSGVLLHDVGTWYGSS